VVRRLDLRFEQYCDGASPALRGQMHWTKADADSNNVAAPAAIPADLWRPDASRLPATGNYLYMESPASAAGPLVSITYTPTNAIFILSGSGVHLGLTAVTVT
jgi:hypothetical protein